MRKKTEKGGGKECGFYLINAEGIVKMRGSGWRRKIRNGKKSGSSEF